MLLHHFNHIRHTDNKRLLFEGWTVIRFWGKDIVKNVDECVRVIEEAIWDIKLQQ